MSPSKVNFKMYQGSTFSEVLRWESSRKVYKKITGISNAAPCIITSTAHGVPNGWKVKVTNVVGMTDINSVDEYKEATVSDLDEIELNSINSVDYKTYVSGGILEYNEPIDLTGFTARMQLREKIDSVDTIDEYNTEDGTIVIDTVNSTITIVVSAVDTAAYTFSSVVYSLELTSSGGIVTPLANGTITLVKEVTK